MREEYAEVVRRAEAAEDEANDLDAKMLAKQGAHRLEVKELRELLDALQREQVADAAGGDLN